MAYLFGAANTDNIDCGTTPTKAATFSMAVRFKATQFINNAYRRLAHYGSATQTNFYSFLDGGGGGNNSTAVGVVVSGSAQGANWDGALAAGAIHTIIMTYDGANVRQYADTDPAVKNYAAKTGTPDASGTMHFLIGNGPGESLSADSTIYEVAWWPGTVLTGAQCATLGGGGQMPYNFPLPSNYWPLVSDANDLIGSANGTVTGATNVAHTGGSWFPVADPPPPPKLWFGPDGASADWPDLFTSPSGWVNARKKITAMKFFLENVAPWITHGTGDAVRVGNNTLDVFIAADAFRWLRRWGIQLAVEAPAYPQTTYVPAVEAVVDALVAAGGHVSRIDLDSTRLRGVDQASQTQAQTITDFGTFWTTITTAYPNIKIGDIEPYPHYDVATHTGWLSALEAAGIHLAHYTIDVDWDDGALVLADLTTIGDAVRALGIEFGFIIDPGHATAADQTYHDDALTAGTSAAGIQADFIEVESWWQRIGGTAIRDLPVNMPESTGSTHTHLVNAIASVYSVTDIPAVATLTSVGRGGWRGAFRGINRGAA